MARPQILEELKSLGWTGPTSYTLPYLNELIERLKSGESPDSIEASRRKTSVKTEGGGRKEKGEWVQDEWPDVNIELPPLDGDEVVINDVRWRHVTLDADAGLGATQRFVPAVKVVRGPKDKGSWEVTDAVEGGPAEGEWEQDGQKYRRSVAVTFAEGTEEPVGVTTVTERYVPYVKPVKEKKVKLPGQTADFDPRTMLRVFENSDMRIRTGGRDWTLVDTDWLQELLDNARGRGDAAVVAVVDGSQEACDVVWLEALVSVKRRLALREEEVNGDAPAAEVAEEAVAPEGDA